MDHDFFRDLSARERLPQRLALRLAPYAGHADAQHLRDDVRHLARGQRIAYGRGDHVGRVLRLPGSNGASGTHDFAELSARFVRDDDSRLRAAPVDSDDDERHARAG